MEHQSEIDLVYQVITHPAGFCLEPFYPMKIKGEDNGAWEVSWENYSNPHDNATKSEWEHLTFTNALQAVQCFVELRHKFLWGSDLEEQQSREWTSYYMLGDKEVAELKTKYGAK